MLLRVIYDFSTLHCQENIQILTYFCVWWQLKIGKREGQIGYRTGFVCGSWNSQMQSAGLTFRLGNIYVHSQIVSE